MSEPNTPPTPTPSNPGPGVATPAPTSSSPPTPAPSPAKTPVAADQGKSRRFFLIRFFTSPFAVAWTTLTASLVGMTLGTVRFLFPNVLSEPPSTFKGGDISSFEENKVEDKFKDQGVWIIKAKDEQGRMTLYALSTVCTHLGCTPNWLEGEKKLKCPCHGSGFKISGVNFEGPAPRPLERYAIRKTDDNQVIVDKSRKFQKELGQWADPDSYILV